MNRNANQLDPVEQALLELHAAERAHVFDRTRVDAAVLARASRQQAVGRPIWLTPRFLAPVAATIVIALGVSSWMFNSHLNELRQAARDTSSTILAQAGSCEGAFFDCLNGPDGAAGSAGCQTYDYDTDGDVDLADFRAYQLACVGPSY